MLLGHRKLAAWYQQLAQHLEAGIPLTAALRAARGAGAPAGAIETMALTLENGGTVEQSLHTAGSWLPFADTLALTAAAAAGRMPQTLRNLAARHAQIGAAKLKMILACAYPLGVLHLGLFILPVVRMIDWEKGFTWSTATYAGTLAITVLPLWVGTIVVWILARRGSPLLTRTARLLPAIGGYMRLQALADFSFVLGNLLEAGVPIRQAWTSAGLVTSARDLKGAAMDVDAMIARGEAPGPRLHSWSCFPSDFVALYRAGETTGQLDSNLLRLASQNQDSANRALAYATFIYPAILFLIVAATVAYFVISIYGGYLKMLGDLAK